MGDTAIHWSVLFLTIQVYGILHWGDCLNLIYMMFLRVNVPGVTCRGDFKTHPMSGCDKGIHLTWASLSKHPFGTAGIQSMTIILGLLYPYEAIDGPRHHAETFAQSLPGLLNALAQQSLVSIAQL